MRQLVMVLVLGAPALALAQPAPPPAAPPGDPAPPPPATNPYDPNAGSGPYAPPPPAGPPPATPYGQPAPYGQPQPYGQPYQPPPPASLRDGMTFEANLGLGWIRIADDNNSDTSDLGVGMGIGVGGWISQQTAITARLAAASFTQNNVTFSAIFLGPSAQYWIDDHFWLGGGIGFGIFGASVDGGDSDSISGLGLNGRVGYTFTTGSENTFNASFELSPGFYSENNSDGTATAITLLVGYQHL